MARTKRWTSRGVVDGVWTLDFSSWKYFPDYVRQEMLDYNQYVWRGDRRDDRPLLPSFDRRHARLSRGSIEARLHRHLHTFQLAVRGRRGPSPSSLEGDNDWWALGQHYGLDTPLLDWTRSPFVALFFAFEKVKSPQSPCRAVYAIATSSCEAISSAVEEHHDGFDRPDVVEFITPYQDENARLVNQNGLFSRCTAGKPLEAWVAEHRAGETQKGVLLRLRIPDTDREECLRALNRMNINHLTLFPDLYGSSLFSNFSDSIRRY